eukprot:1167567-Rhodomonas_salina.1
MPRHVPSVSRPLTCQVTTPMRLCPDIRSRPMCADAVVILIVPGVRSRPPMHLCGCYAMPSAHVRYAAT